jgi:hypothetical protein
MAADAHVIDVEVPRAVNAGLCLELGEVGYGGGERVSGVMAAPLGADAGDRRVGGQLDVSRMTRCAGKPSGTRVRLPTR